METEELTDLETQQAVEALAKLGDEDDDYDFDCSYHDLHKIQEAPTVTIKKPVDKHHRYRSGRYNYKS